MYTIVCTAVLLVALGNNGSWSCRNANGTITKSTEYQWYIHGRLECPPETPLVISESPSIQRLSSSDLAIFDPGTTAEGDDDITELALERAAAREL
jgi:hypothetical protein